MGFIASAAETGKMVIMVTSKRFQGVNAEEMVIAFTALNVT